MLSLTVSECDRLTEWSVSNITYASTCLKHLLIFFNSPLDCLKIQDYFVDNTAAYVSNHHFNK
jgi:hypothetical protein